MQKYQKTLLFTLCFFYFSPLLVVSKGLHLSNGVFVFLIFWCFLAFLTLAYLWKLFQRKTKERLLKSLYEETGYKEKYEYEQQIEHLVERMKLLVEELNDKNNSEKMLVKKIEQLKEMCGHHEAEYQSLNHDLQNQLEKNERSLSESRFTIKDQRRIIEKKQEDINVLNMQLNDLKYEMENILNINKEEVILFKDESIPQSSKEFDFMRQKPSHELTLSEKLGRYIDMTKKMTELSPFVSEKSGYRFPLGTLILDQRRLFDRLENEESEVILVYSLEEKRLIFINNQVKGLLGWNPEKFIKDFPFLVEKGLHQWHEVIEELKEGDFGEVRLLLKTLQGQNILTHCYLKKVPQGAFEGHLLGILSSAAKRGS